MFKFLVGAAGFEPTLAESESDVLPLNYAPKKLHVIIYTLFRFSIKFFTHINVANAIFIFYDFYYNEKRRAFMKQSRTALKELTAAYRAVLRHGILCNAIALGLMAVSTPAMAGAPNTDGYAFVFGDITIPSGRSIETMAFGGRRMSAPEHMNDGKYRNDFPNYSMLGQSLIVGDNNAEDPLYVGPVNLTLRQLTNEQFRYNYQAGADGETDIDLALAPTELVTPLERIGWNDTAAATKVAAVIGESNANYTAPGVVMFSHKDNDATNDGLLSLTKTNAVIDGAMVTADRISVLNSSVTFAKQDTALLNTSSSFYSIVGSDGEGAYDGIRSDGVTTLNADTIDVVGSELEVKPGAVLSFNPTNPNGSVTIHDVTSGYGALTVNGGGSIFAAGESLVFDNNKSTSHGAGLYYKDQSYASGTGTDKVLLASKNITFSNNEVVATATSGSGAGVFATGGKVSILGENNTFIGNKMNAAEIASERLYKTGGGAIANQSYDKEANPNKGAAIDVDMVIGKEDGSSVNVFESNTSKTNGGAIMNRAEKTDGNATLTINGVTTFENNHADIHGGAIYNLARNGKLAEINMTNGTYEFIGNTAGVNGGAIYNSGELTIINSTFRKNTATGNSGAIAQDSTSSKLTLNNVDFVENSSDWGGAIVARGIVYITGGSFTGNSSNDGGGAIYLATLKNKGHKLSIDGTTFTGNHTAGIGSDGGGAIGSFSDLVLKNAIFTGNYVEGSTNGGGAIMMGSVSTNDVSNTTFTSNTSTTNGGAITTRWNQGDNTNSGSQVDGTIDIVGSTFTENIALMKGGAFYNTFYNDKANNGYVTVDSSTFNRNQAANGGAIYNETVGNTDPHVGVMKITGGTFTGNIATTNGGAIYNAGELYLAGNNSFSGNTAATNGGAIYNEGDLYLAGNNNFTGNTAAGKANDIYNFGALYVEGTTTLNGGTTGSGTLVVKDGATLNLGTASITQGQIDLQNGGTINATLDKDATSPLFNATYYTGQGTLKLAMAEIGTYHVFGGESFDIVSDMPWTITNSDRGVAFANSAVYNLAWTKGDVTAEKKSVEEIASGSDIAVESAAVVSNIIDSASNSSSKQMKDLSLKMQEKLAEGTPEAKAEVEHAAAAIHPEKESVVQSVSSSVQNTVTNLASARMSSPMVGRSAGDIQLTSGGVWAQGIFNKSKQNNAFNGYTRGIAVGLDGTFNKDWTIGAGYSYAHSDISGSARDTEIDSSTVFVYGQYKPEQWYLNAVASYTMSDYSESGMAMGTHVISDYDVNAYGLSLATGYDFTSGVTPELGLRYLHVNANDYVNSMGVKTSLKDNDFMTAVLGTKYAFNVVADKYTTFVPQLNVAVKYDLLSDEHVANVTMPGIDTYSLEEKRLSRFGGEFGVGLGIRHKNIDFSVNYDIDVRNDYTSQTGMLKFRCNF